MNNEHDINTGDISEPSTTEKIAAALKQAEGDNETPALGHPSYQELADKLTEMEKKAEENWDKFLRSQAEIKNLEQRAEQNIANAHRYALGKFVAELLPAIDSFESCLEAANSEASSPQSLREGIELTLKTFYKALETAGIRQINPLGEAFNPMLHEAMSVQETETSPPNTVLVVLQKGYQLHDRLVRPARVIVAKSKEA